MNKNFLKLNGDITIKNAIEKFKDSNCSEAYYVGNKNKLLGKIFTSIVIIQIKPKN